MGRRLLAAVLAAGTVNAGAAGTPEFRSVVNPAAILYDAPSVKAKKLYIVNRGYPLEVTVQLRDWTKVRDANGALTWIETKELSDRRTVLVKTPLAQVRQGADDKTPVAFEAQQGVVFDVVSAEAGWLQVRHEDGATGYVRPNQVWGQ
jgi:SH3-like domain-containing protein